MAKRWISRRRLQGEPGEPQDATPAAQAGGADWLFQAVQPGEPQDAAPAAQAGGADWLFQAVQAAEVRTADAKVEGPPELARAAPAPSTAEANLPKEPHRAPPGLEPPTSPRQEVDIAVEALLIDDMADEDVPKVQAQAANHEPPSAKRKAKTQKAQPAVALQGQGYAQIAEHLEAVLPASTGADEAQADSGPSAPSAARTLEALEAQLAAAEREKGGEGYIDLLRHYAHSYSRRQHGLRRSALGPRPSPEDVKHLEAAFSKDVQELGYLSPDCVLLELDLACKLRQTHQHRFLNDARNPEVGNFFKGVNKELYTVEAVLQTAFAMQPLLTISDLEAAVLKMPAFKQQGKFKDAGLGDLARHPEVLRRLRLNHPSLPALPMPKSFPKIKQEEILMGLVENLTRNVWDFQSEDAWTVDKGLTAIAEKRGLPDSRLLGVFVQHENVLKVILAIYKQRVLSQSKSEATAANQAVVKALRQMPGGERAAKQLNHCNWVVWHKTLAGFASLASSADRLSFLQHLTVSSMAGDSSPTGPTASPELQKATDSFLRCCVAPLLFASFTLATSKKLPGISPPDAGAVYSPEHSRSGPELKWLAMEVAKVQKMVQDCPADTADSIVVQTLLQELEEFPSMEPSFVKCLVRAERALVQHCGIQSARELPLSFLEFILVHETLHHAIDAKSGMSSPAVSPVDCSDRTEAATADVDGKQLAQHLMEILGAELRAAKDQLSHTSTVQWLREVLICLGRAERSLCRAYAAKSFAHFGLTEKLFGEFFATFAQQLSESLAPLFDGPSAAPPIVRLLRRLLREGSSFEDALARVSKHFVGLACDEDVKKALSGWSECEPEMADRAQLFPTRSLQVLLAKSGGDDQVQVPSSSVVSQDVRTELIKDAMSVITEVPFLVDLVEAIPEWPTKFQPALGSLFEFLGSDELADAVSSASSLSLPPLGVVEVRCGLLLRVSDGSHETLQAALDGNDARQVAATVLARLLADGAHMPAQKFEASISQWMKQVHEAEEETALVQGLAKEVADATMLSCEVFLLRAISVLPREARQAVGKILASPYVHLRRPRSRIREAAKAAPDFCIAARWLGEHFGILEWTELRWESYYDGTASRPGPPLLAAPGAVHAVATKGAAQAASMPSEVPRSGSSSTASVQPEPAQELSANDPNVRLCSDIARLKAVDLADVDPVSRSWIRDRPVDETTRSLQQTVQGAVKRLAADLYSTETHFLLELLQNVDDCRFVANEVPRLRLILEDSRQEYSQLTSLSEACLGGCVALLALEYNETGFEESNVRALCDIAQSTKTSAERKYIGAKGIGFKSVFRVTDTPIVHSGAYHFHFDKNALDGLGYLIPFPLACPASLGEPDSCRTRVVLPLKEATRVSEVRTHVLEDIQPTLLLFLRNLCTIEVVDRSAGLQKHMSKELANTTTVTLRTVTDGEVQKLEHWRMHTHRIELSSSDAAIQTELKLAFRLNDRTGEGQLGNDRRRPELQQAFAWLPLRSYGFRFILHADWVVPSSREAIVENDPFNQTIRDALPEAFATAIQAMISDMTLRFGPRIANSKESLLLAEEATAESLSTADLEDLQRDLVQLYEVVPVPGDALDFFAPSPLAILQELRHIPFVLARAAAEKPEQARLVLVRPPEAVRSFMPEVPSEWADRVSLLEPLLNAAGYFMEMDVISSRLADALHIPPLNSNVALECMAPFQRLSCRPLSDGDLEQLHLLLLIISADTSPPLARLARLPIVPTESGHLVIPENENVYNVGVGFQGVIPGAKTLSSRFAALMHQRVAGLLHRVGVEHAEGLQFFKQVLVPFLTSDVQPGVEELLQCTHAARRFLQSSEHVEDLTPHLRSGMWVASDCQTRDSLETRSVCWCSPQNPLHLAPLPESLRKVYPQKWLYVSSAYLQSDAEIPSWQKFWTSLGVWPAFAVADGQSQELTALLRALSSATDSGAVAVSLVSFLAPHGELYTPYLQAGDSGSDREGAATHSVRQLLESRPWLPTRGGELVRVQDSWIPAANLLPLEEPFAFAPVVAELKKTWTALSFKAAASPRNLVAIIRKQAAAGRQHSVHEWRCLYGRLMQVLDFTGSDVESQEALDFLRTSRWIFVPEHPRLLSGKRDAFDDRGAAVPRNGQFCSVAEVVFKDDSRLVDTYSRGVTDEASDFARAACGKRIVGQYYWGPYTLFPPHWTGQRFTPQHAEVQELFAKLGVPQFLPWPDFYAILASISAAADRADAGKDPVMLSAAVHVFGHLADEVDHELFESEGSYAVDGGAPVGSAAVAQETSEFAASPTLRQFLDAVKSLRCVPTAGGSWATLQEVRFLHDRQHMATWRGEALQLVAGLADSELPSWEAERLKRAFRYCGLSLPIVSRQARVLRWQRGKEAALAAGLLLAAVRWLLADGVALRGELAEVLRSATRGVEFVEARPANDEPDQEDSAPVQLEEVVEVPKLSAEILAPGAGENSTALLLRSQQAHEDSKNFALVRTPLQMEGYVGHLQEGQEGLDQGVLVVAFAGDAAQAMTTPLAGHIVQQLVDHCLALAEGGCEQTADLAPMKRKLLSRLQQAACQLQTTPPRRLESPALAVERAVRQAGYTGGGSPEDLLPPWAPAISAPAEAETEAIGARTQRWVEAGARTEEPAELPLTVPKSDEEEDPEPAALGAGMAASAAKALSKRTPADATAAPPKSSFVPGLPMAETSAEGDAAVSQSGAGLQPGTGPPGPGFGAGVAGVARENRGAPRLSGGFGIGSRSAEALEKQLRGMVDSFGKEPHGDGQGRHDQDSWSLRAEVDLSAEARASLAQLAELPEDEFTELVGRLGEEVAMHALKKQGFDVIWANGVNETGLPFDLVVRPATTGRRTWPPALAALAQCTGQPKVHSLREIEAALAKLPEAAVVEVKASLADARGDVFDISAAQMSMAQRLGDRYWLALVRKLAAGAGRVQVLQDMDKGVREGRVKLLLVA